MKKNTELHCVSVEVHVHVKLSCLCVRATLHARTTKSIRSVSNEQVSQLRDTRAAAISRLAANQTLIRGPASRLGFTAAGQIQEHIPRWRGAQMRCGRFACLLRNQI